MKRITVLSLCLLVACALHAQAEKNLYKSFKLDSAMEGEVHLPGEVELKEWANDYIQVQFTISLENGNIHMLNALIQGGRYNIESDHADGLLTLLSPAKEKKKELVAGGKLIIETISYTVFVPEDFEVQVRPKT